MNKTLKMISMAAVLATGLAASGLAMASDVQCNGSGVKSWSCTKVNNSQYTFYNKSDGSTYKATGLTAPTYYGPESGGSAIGNPCKSGANYCFYLADKSGIGPGTGASDQGSIELIKQ